MADGNIYAFIVHTSMSPIYDQNLCYVLEIDGSAQTAEDEEVKMKTARENTL